MYYCFISTKFQLVYFSLLFFFLLICPPIQLTFVQFLLSQILCKDAGYLQKWCRQASALKISLGQRQITLIQICF